MKTVDTKPEILSATVYSSRFCSYCFAAKRMLEELGIGYTEVMLDTDPALRSEIMERSGQRTVPQIWIGDAHVGGFDDLRRHVSRGSLQKLIEDAGVAKQPA
ncbi:MAG: glutaredoxin 3 [bacterium]